LGGFRRSELAGIEVDHLAWKNTGLSQCTQACASPSSGFAVPANRKRKQISQSHIDQVE
jgi:hypothetical protein